MIDIQNVSKIYSKNDPPRVDDVSFTIKQGESLVLIGSSGSGKTTLLKMLNGLEEPTSGAIYIKDKDILSYDLNELRRTFFGYVFQKVGLFPHMTIKENILIVLRLNKIHPDLYDTRVYELLSGIHLDPDEYLDRYPHQLSGGEQQRVGVARALATESECLLMDEPFGALDAVTRNALQDEVIYLKEKLKKTIVFVTHDISEAFKLGDRIAVMKEGKVEQIGTQRQLSFFPRTSFVEELVQTGLKMSA